MATRIKEKNWHNTVESTKKKALSVKPVFSSKTGNKPRKKLLSLFLFIMMLEVIPRTMGQENIKNIRLEKKVIKTIINLQMQRIHKMMKTIKSKS